MAKPTPEFFDRWKREINEEKRNIEEDIKRLKLEQQRRANKRKTPEGKRMREEAEKNLQNENPDERKKAADSLGQLMYSESYDTLLLALKKETQRAPILSILKALDAIGEEYSALGMPPKLASFTRGQSQLALFIENHTYDIETVKLALSALSWTGSMEQVDKVHNILLRRCPKIKGQIWEASLDMDGGRG